MMWKYVTKTSCKNSIMHVNVEKPSIAPQLSVLRKNFASFLASAKLVPDVLLARITRTLTQITRHVLSTKLRVH